MKVAIILNANQGNLIFELHNINFTYNKIVGSCNTSTLLYKFIFNIKKKNLKQNFQRNFVKAIY